VIAVSKADGTKTVLVEGAPTVSNGRAAIVVAGDNVYFTRPESGVVASIPVAGGSVVTLATNQPAPTALAVDATHVYWSNAGDGSIWRIAR
jgi:hypothetical protein